MTKVTYHSKRLSVEAEGQKELFEAVAQYQEVFEIDTCKACGGNDLRFVVREVDGNKFYEIRCQGCRAKLPFGQHKQNGTLFPKEWVKWDHENKVEVAV